MNWIDQCILLATSGVSFVAAQKLVVRQTNSASKHSSNIFHLISFLTFFLVGLSLTIFGWQILGLMGDGMSNKMVAIIASLIPLAWATGLVARFFPSYKTAYALLMLVGLALISVSRFVELTQFARVVYPVFHSIAGLTVIVTPLIMVKQKRAKRNLLWISIGGLLISLGGISLAFLSAGRQLLFFSEPVVLGLMAPLLFITCTTYAWGIIEGEIS